jgi:hypothetical protein
VDLDQRDQWRKRLTKAHGAWLCAICKCAYSSQAQFTEMAGVVELVRHSECGHVLMYRDGGTDWLEPYLAEMRMPVAPPRPPRGSRRWKA